MLICFNVKDLLLLRGGHHHLAELVKVHRAGAILVNLSNNTIKIFIRQVGVHLRKDSSKLSHRDETLKMNDKMLSVKCSVF